MAFGQADPDSNGSPLLLLVMLISPNPQPTVLEPNALRRDRLNLSTEGNRVRNWLLLGAVALLAILVAGLVLLVQNWPFTRAQVEKDLAQATFSTVVIESFQQTYFPRPGCIAKGVTFRRNQDRLNPPLITVKLVRPRPSSTQFLR